MVFDSGYLFLCDLDRLEVTKDRISYGVAPCSVVFQVSQSLRVDGAKACESSDVGVSWVVENLLAII